MTSAQAVARAERLIQTAARNRGPGAAVTAVLLGDAFLDDVVELREHKREQLVDEAVRLRLWASWRRP